MPDVEAFMRDRRDELSKVRDQITNQIDELQAKLTRVEKEWKALEAYEQIMQGSDKTTRTPRAATGTRSPKGEKQAAILETIKHNPGIDTKGICEKLQVNDEKGIASIRAAIFQLSKAGKIEKEGKGKYVATHEDAEEKEAAE